MPHEPQTLFISDLHLDPERQDILRLFGDFLEGLDSSNTDALYILGDLFEVWVGDDETLPAYLEVMAMLQRAAGAGLDIHVMHGNRDFLLGQVFAARTGVRLLPDMVVIDLYGAPTLLMHGDLLCTDDLEYQRFRAMVRDPAWQRDFLDKPLEERRAMALGMRETSREQTAGKRPDIMDINTDALLATLRERDVRQLIHGHTHRPAVHEFELDGRPARRIVLGDWYDQGSVLRFSASGPRLETLGWPLPRGQA